MNRGAPQLPPQLPPQRLSRLTSQTSRELQSSRLPPPELTAPQLPSRLPPAPPPRQPPPGPPGTQLSPRLPPYAMQSPPPPPPPQITPALPEQITPASPPPQKEEIKNISDLKLPILLFIVIFGVSLIVPLLFLTHSDKDTTTTTNTETTTDTDTNTYINTILSIICIVISFLISLFLFINKFYDYQLLNVILIVLMITNVAITVIIYNDLNKLNNKNKNLFWINVPFWIVVYGIHILLTFAKGWNEQPTTYQHTKP